MGARRRGYGRKQNPSKTDGTIMKPKIAAAKNSLPPNENLPTPDVVNGTPSTLEDDVEALLTSAYDRGDLADSGLILKFRLRMLLLRRIQKNQFTSIDPDTLEKVLTDTGFLQRRSPKEGFHVYKIDLKKLPNRKIRPVITDDVVDTKYLMTRLTNKELVKKMKNWKKNPRKFDDSYMKFLENNLAGNKQILEVESKADRFLMKVITTVTNVSEKSLLLTEIWYIKETDAPVIMKCDNNLSAGESVDILLDPAIFTESDARGHLILQAEGIGTEYVEIHTTRMINSLAGIIRLKRAFKELAAEHAFTPHCKFQNTKRLGDYWPDQGLLKIFTEDFKIKDNVVNELDAHEFARYKRLVDFKKNGNQLAPHTYVDVLQLLVEIEDLYLNHTLMRFVIPKIRTQVKNASTSFINIAEFVDFPEIVGEWDFIKLHKTDESGKAVGKPALSIITKISNECIFFDAEGLNLSTEADYQVSFQKDRTCLQMENEALATVEEKVIENILFPTSKLLENQKEVAGDETKGEDEEICYRWYNPSIRQNAEQQQAVKNIVNGSAAPAPYVIFGPPGTGKTSTIVEAIAQIWKLKPKANILVTAPSNFACDEIASRLLKYIPAIDMYRCYSKSQVRRIDRLDENLVNISNLANGEHKYPTAKVLKAYRIILTSFVYSGRFALNRMDKNHFQYIFLDECASAAEPSSLIPIAGMVSYKKRTKPTNIIVAGDPRQLGPIIGCNFVEIIGLGRSMLERLMDMDIYMPVEGKYNEKYITKLLQNFRSHAGILRVPSELFYDGQLIPMAPPSITDFALNWHLLPNKQLPLIFHSVQGQTEKQVNSFSLYNDKEIDEIVKYVREICKFVEVSEIGIISPYRLQCQKISMRLKHVPDCTKLKLHKVQVGSAEQFQGKEKKVIILSTVRSNTSTAGFLGNAKRFNVVITRAKGLLIVIGNPKTLQMDLNWYKFIEYCKLNMATRGTDFSLNKPIAALVNSRGRPIQTYEDVVTRSLDSLYEQFKEYLVVE